MAWLTGKRILDLATPDDCTVVAAHGGDGLVIHTANPDPARLADIARSLLVQARDMLEDSTDRTSARTHGLWADVNDAIAFLPDPHADDDGDPQPEQQQT